MTTKRKPKLNADVAFENAHLVAQDLVGRIGELLHDMPFPGDDDNPITWGNVGEIGEVINHLSSCVSCKILRHDHNNLNP